MLFRRTGWIGGGLSSILPRTDVGVPARRRSRRCAGRTGHSGGTGCGFSGCCSSRPRPRLRSMPTIRWRRPPMPGGAPSAARTAAQWRTGTVSGSWTRGASWFRISRREQARARSRTIFPDSSSTRSGRRDDPGRPAEAEDVGYRFAASWPQYLTESRLGPTSHVVYSWERGLPARVDHEGSSAHRGLEARAPRGHPPAHPAPPAAGVRRMRFGAGVPAAGGRHPTGQALGRFPPATRRNRFASGAGGGGGAKPPLRCLRCRSG